MTRLKVEPRTLAVPRPMPDEVLVLTCDAAGATCSLNIPRQIFAEMTSGTGLMEQLEHAAAVIHESGRPVRRRATADSGRASKT